VRPAGENLSLGPEQLIPCVVQDAATGDVLMLAWVDDEALQATQQTGEAHFHSRSRDELWHKGATSGNTMEVVSLRLDCDADTLLMRVLPHGPACHTGTETCFGERVTDARPSILAELAAVIEERRASADPRSFVAATLAAERERAARKVGEEAVEVLLAPAASDALVGEVADLWFHSMLLLARDGIDPLAPLEELARRRSEAQ
jgi:phosphoribosyl-AMP cyclohydrolase / phosphoribosyl-ATP pyrophosphohydrolase